MDMNRKSRFGLKNIKTQMALPLMQKFVMVVTVFFMMAGIGFAGPFLAPDENDVSNILVTSSGTDLSVINQSNGDDSWDYTYNYGYTGSKYSGYYIGTFNGNISDGNDYLLLIQKFLDDPDLTLVGYAKDEDSTDNTGNLTVTVTPTEWKLDDGDPDYDEPIAGTWEVNNSISDDDTINFYAVKGSNQYALYYVNPALNTGNWSTEHLLNGGGSPALSHLTVAKIIDSNEPNNPPGAVPEPATMLLFGFSLMGLAGMARRRNSKF